MVKIFMSSWEFLTPPMRPGKQFGLKHEIGKVAHEPRRPAGPEIIPVSVAWGNWEYCYSPLYGMLGHHRVTPSSMSPVPIYTFVWRETMWAKVSCPRKQHDGRDWASNHRPSDLKSKELTTTPSRSYMTWNNACQNCLELDTHKVVFVCRNAVGRGRMFSYSFNVWFIFICKNLVFKK